MEGLGSHDWMVVDAGKNIYDDLLLLYQYVTFVNMHPILTKYMFFYKHNFYKHTEAQIFKKLSTF